MSLVPFKYCIIIWAFSNHLFIVVTILQSRGGGYFKDNHWAKTNGITSWSLCESFAHFISLCMLSTYKAIYDILHYARIHNDIPWTVTGDIDCTKLISWCPPDFLIRVLRLKTFAWWSMATTDIKCVMYPQYKWRYSIMSMVCILLDLTV